MGRLIVALMVIMSGCATTSSNSGKPVVIQGQLPSDASGYIIQQTESALYVGDVRNGKPHGRGTMYLKNKMIMTGDWVDGELAGQGISISIVTDSVSVGGFKGGLQNGRGFVAIDGLGYYGQISDGVPDGVGECYSNGTVRDCDPLK